MDWVHLPLFLCSILFLFEDFTQADVFTSVMKMKNVPLIESELIQYLEQYIKVSDRNPDVQNLENFVVKAKLENVLILSDPTYVENPINSYRLLRRVAGEWNEVIDGLICRENCDANATSSEFTEKVEQLKQRYGYWPREDDITGAALALIRLQKTYKLPTEKLAAGVIYDSETAPLTAYDLYSIAAIADERELAYESVLWYNQSASAYQNERGADLTRLVRSMKKLSSAWFRFGLTQNALRVTTKALDYDPQNAGLQRDLKFYSDAVQRMTEEDKYKTFKRPPHPLLPYYPTYEALCRGQIKTPRQMAKLLCTYRKTDWPFLRTKVEYANVVPPVVLFHDVINDDEIEWLKNTAIEQLSRSVLGDVDNKKSDVFSEARISETAWIADNYDMAARLGRRITRITGLDASVRHWDTHAEPFQVLNYGLGGMYEPHYDSTKLYRESGLENNLLFKNAGDRIATWMFYLTDVQAGGATVFPTLRARVPPMKGSAAFWYNIKRNGVPDDLSLHAGCPVLLGNKWGANKWFREIGQAFRYKCSTDPKE